MPTEAHRNAPSGVLTKAMLEAAIDSIRNDERHPHGSPENPHMVHPDRPNVCLDCGEMRSHG